MHVRERARRQQKRLKETNNTALKLGGTQSVTKVLKRGERSPSSAC